MESLLSIRNLTVAIGGTKIIDDVSLDIAPGKIVGLVGGSGSGKTTLGLAILRLLPAAMRLTAGQILFAGRDLAQLEGESLRCLRGKDIGMVFQEPLSAFDPLFTIGSQMEETLAAHTDLNAKVRQARVLETLRSVEIDDPARIARSYPHQLSGGLRQRAMIAQAIVCRPVLIIADEPISSLDVATQAKIMALLRKLNQEGGMTILLIAHDLGMVGGWADHAAVMWQGKIVESGAVADVLRRPRHEYTKALIEAY